MLILLKAIGILAVYLNLSLQTTLIKTNSFNFVSKLSLYTIILNKTRIFTSDFMAILCSITFLHFGFQVKKLFEKEFLMSIKVMLG